ncbi:unnamed protein product [Gadus morhua 'NCC']
MLEDMWDGTGWEGHRLQTESATLLISRGVVIAICPESRPAAHLGPTSYWDANEQPGKATPIRLSVLLFAPSQIGSSGCDRSSGSVSSSCVSRSCSSRAMETEKLEQQVASVERGMALLKREHLAMLAGLQIEISRLKRRCSELNCELDARFPAAEECVLVSRCQASERLLEQQACAGASVRAALRARQARAWALGRALRSDQRRFLEELKRRSHRITALGRELQRQTLTSTALGQQLYLQRGGLVAGGEGGEEEEEGGGGGSVLRGSPAGGSGPEGCTGRDRAGGGMGV